LPVPFTPEPDAGFVALGFLSIFDSFAFVDKTGASQDLNTTITGLNAANPIQSLTVLGHSLGGALATLAAAQLALQDTAGVQSKMSIYTFASPRVGLLDFAASFNDAVQTSFRIWNTLDIVPELPTFPYIHVSGFGDGIIQTEDQLATLTLTPGCEHHLTSYLWLLDAASFALPADCSNAVDHPALTAFAAAADRAAVHTSGVRRMRKTMVGRA
jgi:alpha-beta hydrolase superfamily lysophospholipase